MPEAPLKENAEETKQFLWPPRMSLDSGMPPHPALKLPCFKSGLGRSWMLSSFLYVDWHLVWLLSYFSLQVFLHQRLSGSKSSQVSRILLWILADFYNAIVCMASILPLISISSSLLSCSLETSTCTNHNWYPRNPYFPQPLLLSDKIQISIYLSAFLFTL